MNQEDELFYNKAFDLIVPFEGAVPHFYLDIHGYVTIGVGCLITGSQAPTLVMEISTPAGGYTAHPDEVLEDYVAVSKAPPALPASSYRRFTRCSLTPLGVRSLFEKRCRESVAQLEKLYPGFEDFPIQARLALLDICFNVGIGNLRRNWPSLNDDIAHRDWRTAALHSHRKESSAHRNQTTEALFLEAATA